jgi:DNA-binding NtrC family response regulator/CHASE2 domain-containing sensor protein
MKVKRINIIKIILIVIITAFMLLFYPSARSLDTSITELMHSIAGEKSPDSSIVIIEISEEDIEKIGPWPIKRSFYALLINNLEKFNVKKIGIEVFLSAKYVSQAIYDRVLQNEIEKNSNIVLSSVAGQISEAGKLFKTDSLSFPSPKLVQQEVSSGHINFIKKYGVHIPLKLSNGELIEKAFSSQLIDNKIIYDDIIKINFISSWQKFRKYSLIEFMQMAQSGDRELKSLKDKIIIIGVSDPLLAANITTRFDDNIPGVALHAFALDNLLNERWFNNKFYDLSIIIFIIFIILILVFYNRFNLNLAHYIIFLSIFLIVSFILNRFFYIELAYIFYLIPLLILFLVDSYDKLRENRKLLSGYYNETELLKRLLNVKEKELELLQKELNFTSSDGAQPLIQKIKFLKSEIEKIKDNDNDKLKADYIKNETSQNFNGIVYKSQVMQNAVDLILKTAPSDATVLITGESGTGKELVARAIHNLSKRRHNNFIAINCAALTESLLESELFGHVKGAFTGALSDKPGKFELANDGTIFLDEIGETSENFQLKLLRVLQSGEYDKVGGEKTLKTNVRVISATNKNLKELVKEKKFREDLYYRLNVINIHLAPLRERKEDIDVITEYFLNRNGENLQISVAALKALNEYEWKGNVRELESVILRAKVFCQSADRNLIQLNDLPEEIIKNSKIAFEDLVIESLRNKKFSHSSINETAKELGSVNRTLISENFRGYAFKILFENNFDLDKSALLISGSKEDDVINKVRSKLEIWINNIKKDIKPDGNNDFIAIKVLLNSKYKNLPQKFHIYLDEVIRNLLKN